jgi:hypothetical protein
MTKSIQNLIFYICGAGYFLHEDAFQQAKRLHEADFWRQICPPHHFTCIFNKITKLHCRLSDVDCTVREILADFLQDCWYSLLEILPTAL